MCSLFVWQSLAWATRSCRPQQMGKSAKVGRMPALAKNKQSSKGAIPRSELRKPEGVAKKSKLPTPAGKGGKGGKGAGKKSYQ